MAKKTPAAAKKKMPVKKKVVKTTTTSAAKEVAEVEEPKSGSDSTGRSFIGYGGMWEIKGMNMSLLKAELKKAGAKGLSKMNKYDINKLAFELLWSPDLRPPDTMTHEDVMSLNLYQRTREVAWWNLCKHYKIPKTNTAAWGKFYYFPARIGEIACCGCHGGGGGGRFYDVYQGREKAGTLPPGTEEAGDLDPFEAPYNDWDLNADEVALVCVGFAHVFLADLFNGFEGQWHVETRCDGAWNPPENPRDFHGTPAYLINEEERKAYAKGFTEALNSIRVHYKTKRKRCKRECKLDKHDLFHDVLEECCKRAGQTFVKDQWKERIKESKNGRREEECVENDIKKYLESLR